VDAELMMIQDLAARWKASKADIHVNWGMVRFLPATVGRWEEKAQGVFQRACDGGENQDGAGVEGA